MSTDSAPSDSDLDAVVVGAGFAGLYLIKRLRDAGLDFVVLESADDIGGTWYWNRYPGARCDIQSLDYQFTWDPELEETWTWSEKYATQPEILAYMDHVATKHDLRSHIRFNTKVDRAVWDEDDDRWTIHTEGGDELRARHYIMATGCLSVPKDIDIPGHERFQGPSYLTGRWPHDGVDFTGKRVAVIGTGSSGIQSIPLIAEQAEALTVFQRTPNYSVPAFNGPIPEDKIAARAGRVAEYQEEARWSRGGVPNEMPTEMALATPKEERDALFERQYAKGELWAILTTYADVGANAEANDLLCEFIRDKIREKVDDPEVAELLCPTDYPFGTKRPCLDTNYYETFNLDHVRLVDLKTTPIRFVTETGIETTDESFEFDAIVYATGFDAMTGAIVAVDIEGRDGVTLKEKWEHGPETYLGLTTHGFPNLFLITGPGSPSVLSNMIISIEQHVDWTVDAIEHLRDEGLTAIEPTPTAESAWVRHVNDWADISLFQLANSWYLGANVPGKPRVFLPYLGGCDRYRQICNEVAEQDYFGFERRGPDEQLANDGVIRRLQPDIELMLEMMAELGAPPIESLDPDTARAFMAATEAARPPGPEVGEQIDGELEGAAGPLPYRLYRPATPGPHPVVAYFHGGGWVLGSATSDEPFCRDLCVQADAVVVSVDYRHAPEHRFPAAADDAFAALGWIAEHFDDLGGNGRLAVAGWSAGGNIATVAAQRARDEGGPELVGQVLITPVTTWDPDSPSLEENAEGYMLTRALMEWFWDHYADESDRTDPKASPMRGTLTGLPPTLVVTAEFDPLRDQGAAYAQALAASGVAARHLPCRGQIHTSIVATDQILSSRPIRTEIATELAKMLQE